MSSVGFKLARPLLFMLDAERAHDIGLDLLGLLGNAHLDSVPVKTAFGELPNPVGLPAGYDKSGRHLAALARMGFGYLVAGTFTVGPWQGNPRPRVARNASEKTIVNALGFPNPGIDEFARAVEKSGPLPVPLLASVSGRTVQDVLDCYAKAQPHVQGVELNLSSPNTANLRDLREPPAFAELARAMGPLKRKPTYLKVPPHLGEEGFAPTVSLVKQWEELGFEGVTASNTIPVADTRMAVGRGGYSGPPLLEHTMAAVKAIRASVSRSFEVNAVGGISTPGDVAALLRAGATTVQIFTALVYEGPSLLRRVTADTAVKEAAKSRSSVVGG